ncbi:TPA: hypothetical protein N0F65_010488 [Lagenidium giganteum]|uniref:Purple acid phosphatase n=1 Tax=Lagenidium giganteum TaxID=4803 RepID=A0AAV2Z6Q3_9STRA|nr:TPA: hypothetical protein N0F65_010488 [Lagenidium giganteum]
MENALRGGAWTFHAAGEREPCAGARSDCQFVDNLPPGLVGRSLVDAEGLSVSEPQAFKDVVASIPSQFEGGKAVLSVSSTLIPHLSSVSVTFQLQGKVPSKNNWVGVYCVDAHPSSVSDDEYMDWKWTNGKRRGTVTFAKLTNMRCAWQFRFFTSIIGKYVKIGESSLVHFINGPTEPLSAVSAPQVWYGTDAQSLTKTARGSGTTYRASDMCHEPATKEGAQWFRDPGVMYNAFMTGLDPAKTYFYRVGNASGVQSPVFMLKTPPAAGRQNGTASFFVYGDLGDWNIKATGDAPAGRTATTIDLVRQDMNDQHTNYVAIMHDGDISYGMGRTYLWDQFGTLIQPVSTEIPYMVAVGNHEYCHTSGGEKDPSGAPGNGFHPDGGNYGGESQGECGVPFDKRFIMPNNGNRAFWWSVEMGLVHHTVISSEHDFTTGSTMFKWLEQDLQSVDRKKTPWLLLHLHRPMYYAVSLMIRKHLEPLLGKYRVDVVFSGHYHAYERTCPVYNEQCRSAPLANGLEQAQAPVHFMVGSGGADVDNTTYYNVPWRAAAMMEYGYGRVHVLNATHAKLEFKRNRDNSIPDSAWVISDHAWSV